MVRCSERKVISRQLVNIISESFNPGWTIVCLGFQCGLTPVQDVNVGQSEDVILCFSVCAVSSSSPGNSELSTLV